MHDTVKTFNVVGTKFRGLMAMAVFVDTWIRGFQIILNITKVNKYVVGILNSWIVLPTKYTKLNVQQIRGFHSMNMYIINISTHRLKWRPMPDKMREFTLGHNVQRNLGQSEDWIFWVSVVTPTCNVWHNELSRHFVGHQTSFQDL